MPKLSPNSWQAVSPYLDRALGMTDQERAGFLAALRRQNPATAADLEVLLEEYRVLGL